MRLASPSTGARASEYDGGVTRTDRAWRLGLFGALLFVASAHASPEGRTCIREGCKPQGQACARAFREAKSAAIAACAEGETSTAVSACRKAARQAARDGIRSCKTSKRNCTACCRDAGDACHVAVCGNRLVEGDEACDGTTTGSCALGCRADCTCVPATQPVCGNATAESGEQCDGTDDDACPQRCRPDCTCGPEPALCGNGVIDAGEECDGASHAACEVACNASCACVAPVCGNGILGGTEACDGPSDAACPGLCGGDCTCGPPPPVCGNDVHEAGEQCEPSVNDFACDVGCLPDCTCAVCGNGVIQAPVEVCEPTDDAACPGLCSSQSCLCLSPTTDTCEGARELATFPAADRQSTIGATLDATDPPFLCGFNGAPTSHAGTVWYALTAPRTGRVTADTGGSFIDTLLAAYTGTCGALTSIVCNDDTAVSLNARIEFPVVEGSRYFLQAAGYSGSTGGDLVLAVDFKPCGDGVLDAGEECDPGLPGTCSTGVCTVHCECLPAAADECADAVVATELPIHETLAASQGTAAAADPVLLCSSNFESPPSVWFRFVAPTDGTVDITTDGSDYDTVLGLFTGQCGALTVANCNDDAAADNYQSHIVQSVTAGTTYTVLVNPYRGDPANRLELSIAYEASP